jgi:hypothetical protein
MKTKFQDMLEDSKVLYKKIMKLIIKIRIF